MCHPTASLPAGHLNRLLSDGTSSEVKTASFRASTVPTSNTTRDQTQTYSTEITLNGTRYRSISFANVTYDCHSRILTNRGSHIDRGTNGGSCGTDIRIIERT